MKLFNLDIPLQNSEPERGYDPPADLTPPDFVVDTVNLVPRKKDKEILIHLFEMMDKEDVVPVFSNYYEAIREMNDEFFDPVHRFDDIDCWEDWDNLDIDEKLIYVIG